MLLHKLITGGENWLPFALSKLRALRQRVGDDGYGSNHFSMPDGAEVKVGQAGKQQFLRLSGAPSCFEFLFTGNVLATSTATFPVVGEVATTKGHVIQVTLKKKSTGIELAARRTGSNTVLPNGLEPENRYEPTETMSRFTALKFYQIEGVMEPRYFPKKQPNWQVMHSFGATTQFAGMHYGVRYGSEIGIQIIDASYDLMTYNWKGGRRGAAKQSRPESDFYRAGAVTKTLDGNFMLMVDTSNVLHVWRHEQPLVAGAENLPNGTATVEHATAVALPLPAWAYQPVGAFKDAPWPVSPIGHPHYMWAFDSTGTRLVAVVPEDMGEIPPVYMGVEPGETPDVFYFTLVNGGVTTRRHEILLGMVEFSVSVSGGKDEDGNEIPPTVAITAGRTIRPSTDARYILAAAYGWDLGNVSVAQDDLLLIEQQIYVKPPDVAAGIDPAKYFTLAVPDMRIKLALRSDAHDEVRYVVKNVQQATTLRNFCMRKLVQNVVDMVPTTLPADYARVEMETTLLALDLKAMAFAFETRIVRMHIPAGATQSSGTPYAWAAEFKVPRIYRAFHNNEEVHIARVSSDAYPALPLAINTSDKLYDGYFMDSVPTGTVFPCNATETIGTVTDEYGVPGWGGIYLGGTHPDGLTELTPAQQVLYKAIWSASWTGHITWANSPVGAFEHSLATTLLWPDPMGNFACHPEGHYSLCLGALRAYTGVVSAVAPIDPALISGAYIDILRFKTGPSTQIVKTHLELANEACGSTVTYDTLYQQATYPLIASMTGLGLGAVGLRLAVTKDGGATTIPPAPSAALFYPAIARSLGIFNNSHISAVHASPRKHPMWIGNFDNKLRAAGWSNEAAP